MALCMNYLPSERIRVFISSAQHNENGFAWSDVRRRIKDCLSQCIYFNPFIIEDEASVMSSTQFFLRQVERADVVVILVKGDVRTGTATEYALSKKLNKPLLVYFLEDSNPNDEVQKLRKDLQNIDSCTYRPVSNFSDIETIIRSDLMNNVVRAFQDRYYSSVLDVVPTAIVSLPEDKFLSNSSIPSKTEIGKFSSCYNYLFELLHLDYLKIDTPEATEHTFGCQLVQSIVTGSFAMHDAELGSFITSCTHTFDKIDWLQKRWDAIKSYFTGELDKALTFEEDALALAKSAGESNWVINNILIDCRNLENEKNKLNRIFTIGGKFQEELSNQEHIVFLPVLDRYLNNAYEQVEKDEFRVETASRYTELYGTGLSSALMDWVNYLFSAAVYGSYTHLQISRKILATLLSRYSIITDNSWLAFIALKQYILFGNSKECKLYLDSTWDRIYSLVASHADELWTITDCVPLADCDMMKQTILSAVGLYLSDEVFADAESYMFDYSNSVYGSNSETYFEAILPNLHRMNQEKVIIALTAIIKNKGFQFGNKLSHIILHMNLGAVSTSVLSAFAVVIKEHLQFIVSNNGDPQMIAALVERDKSLFGDLETQPNNGLTGIQKKLYKINTGSQNWLPILKDEIESAERQFVANSEKGTYCDFVENPYAMISYIIRNEDSKEEIDSIILDKFIPHVVEVLSSEAAVPTKESCISCLCDILAYFVKKEISLPDLLIEALRTVDIQKGTDFFPSKSRKSFEIRVLMAKIIAGVNDIDGLLKICIDFGNLKTSEKIVAIDGIEKYLFQRKNNLYDVSELVVSLVLQLTTENEPDIRKLAYRCVSYILQSPYKSIAELTMNKAAFDPSSKVRSTILTICKQGYMPEDISNNLINLLRKDANFIIRKRAHSMG